MSTIFVYIGLPGSGKSTHAQKWASSHKNCTYLSSDAIRAELYGDENIQGDPNKVFSIMRQRAKEAVSKGFDVVYDATNLTYKDRQSILQIPNATFIARVFAIPINECKRRNSLRERKVLDYVIEKMVRRWQTPCEWEGFKSIEIYGIFSLTYDSLVEPMKNFNQHNPHHSLSLYGHCEKTGDALPSEELSIAGYLHDCGKPYTQSFDEKGIAHYYSHENYGAYLSLLINYDISLRVSQLITWHMAPYNIRYWDKMKKVMDVNFIKDIEALHRADEEAH